MKKIYQSVTETQGDLEGSQNKSEIQNDKIIFVSIRVWMWLWIENVFTLEIDS